MTIIQRNTSFVVLTMGLQRLSHRISGCVCWSFLSLFGETIFSYTQPLSIFSLPQLTPCRSDFKYIWYVMEFLVAARFSALVQTGPGAHPGSYTVATGSLAGIKRPGRGINHPPSSTAEVKEIRKLYIYSPFVP